jgi:type IV fimbrial biogenesis protein FimT
MKMDRYLQFFAERISIPIRQEIIMGKKRNKKILFHGRQGFSLMELCVIVAIIAIIAAIGIPNLLGMRERYQLRATATDVLSVLKKARTEAIKRNVPVAVEFTGSSYTVFIDDGSGGGVAADKDKHNETILDTTTLPSGMTLSYSNAALPSYLSSVITTTLGFTTAPKSVVEFNAGGLAMSGSSKDSSGSLAIYKDKSLKVAYELDVSLAGLVTLKSYTF